MMEPRAEASVGRDLVRSSSVIMQIAIGSRNYRGLPNVNSPAEFNHLTARAARRSRSRLPLAEPLRRFAETPPSPRRATESRAGARRPRKISGGFYFVFDYGKRNAKRYNFGCNLFLFLPFMSQKSHPKSYRLAKNTSLHKFITQTKQKPPSAREICLEPPAAS